MKDSIFIKYRMLIGGLLISAAAAFSVFSYLQMQKEKEKADSLEVDIKKLSEEKISIFKKIREVGEEKAWLSVEEKGYKEKIQRYQEEILKIEPVRVGLSKQFSEKQEQISVLNNRLNSIAREESELSDELKKSQSDYQDTARRIDDTRKEKAALEERIKVCLSVPEGVELKKIVVKISPSLEGKIIELNAEYSFAIIDLGIDDNLESGKVMGIYRKDSFIAQAVVENVYENMSSIIVLDQWSDAQIATGDTVRLVKS